MLLLSVQFACAGARESLFAIHAATGGDTWSKGRDWFKTDNYCEWEGIKCGDNSEIIALDFSDFGLRDTLPDEIGCFPELKTLYLNRNMIKTFPKQICRYARTLQFLQMSGTGLEDIDSCICDFSYLKYLYLDNNRLNGSLPQCDFPHMDQFIGSCNEFTGTVPKTYEHINKVFLGCNPDLDCVGAKKNIVCGNEDCTGCALVCPAVWDDSVCGVHYLVRQ